MATPSVVAIKQATTTMVKTTNMITTKTAEVMMKRVITDTLLVS